MQANGLGCDRGYSRFKCGGENISFRSRREKQLYRHGCQLFEPRRQTTSQVATNLGNATTPHPGSCVWRESHLAPGLPMTQGPSNSRDLLRGVMRQLWRKDSATSEECRLRKYLVVLKTDNKNIGRECTLSYWSRTLKISALNVPCRTADGRYWRAINEFLAGNILCVLNSLANIPKVAKSSQNVLEITTTMEITTTTNGYRACNWSAMSKEDEEMNWLKWYHITNLRRV